MKRCESTRCGQNPEDRIHTKMFPDWVGVSVLRTCVAKHDGEVFRFQILDFERANEGLYKICFRDVEIGEFDAEALRFRPVQVMR